MLKKKRSPQAMAIVQLQLGDLNEISNYKTGGAAILVLSFILTGKMKSFFSKDLFFRYTYQLVLTIFQLLDVKIWNFRAPWVRDVSGKFGFVNEEG